MAKAGTRFPFLDPGAVALYSVDPASLWREGRNDSPFRAPRGEVKRLARETGISERLLKAAHRVETWAPDLADRVIGGELSVMAADLLVRARLACAERWFGAVRCTLEREHHLLSNQLAEYAPSTAPARLHRWLRSRVAADQDDSDALLTARAALAAALLDYDPVPAGVV